MGNTVRINRRVNVSRGVDGLPSAGQQPLKARHESELKAGRRIDSSCGDVNYNFFVIHEFLKTRAARFDAAFKTLKDVRENRGGRVDCGRRAAHAEAARRALHLIAAPRFGDDDIGHPLAVKTPPDFTGDRRPR